MFGFVPDIAQSIIVSHFIQSVHTHPVPIWNNSEKDNKKINRNNYRLNIYLKKYTKLQFKLMFFFLNGT